jgi:hypothetical protein
MLPIKEGRLAECPLIAAWLPPEKFNARNTLIAKGYLNYIAQHPFGIELSTDVTH